MADSFDGKPRRFRGFTLAEMVVAMAVLGITLVGLTRAFNSITNAVLSTRARSLGSNITQEQMEILKQRSYFRIMVTTAAETWPGTELRYDPGYYPPDTIVNGGVTFTRLTLVEIADEVEGDIQTFPPTTPDGGMKLITTHVLWNQPSGAQSLTLKNIASNPDMAMTTSFFVGTVRDSVSFVPIQGANVSLLENPTWQDLTSPAGAYKVGAVPNVYNLSASAPGYFTQTRIDSLRPPPNNINNQPPFDLVKMASGAVRGAAWINDHLVISRVVGSSVTVDDFDQEFVEIFNPTTWTWLLGGQVGLKFGMTGPPSPINVIYSTPLATIGPGAFFLYANTSPVRMAGQTVYADAVWESTPLAFAGPASNVNNPNFIYFDPDAIPPSLNIIPVRPENPGAFSGIGALELYVMGGETLDVVGWSGGGGGTPPGSYEAAYMPESIGLQREEVYRRRCSTTGYDSSLGPAYDSGNNSVDWVTASGISEPPRSSTAPVAAVLSGVPAIGAVVSANDGLSAPAIAARIGNPPHASFVLSSVATGTWRVMISSGFYTHEVSPFVAANTVLPLGVSGHVLLTSEAVDGIVSGKVTTNGVTPLPGIAVSAGTTWLNTSATGLYSLRVPPSVYNITANPNSASNPSYVSETVSGVTVILGQVTADVNFVLSQGGRLRAFVTRNGSTPLPGIAVQALDPVTSLSEAEAVSQNDGYVQLINLSTGNYTVRPILDSGESSAPISQGATVNAGLTTWVTTFTVTNAFGSVAGRVLKSGAPITTGVLVVVTQDSLPGANYPPRLSTTTLAGVAYYSAISDDTGRYSMEVRGSPATYNVYGYYSTVTGTAAAVQKVSGGAITVNAGFPTSKDLSW